LNNLGNLIDEFLGELVEIASNIEDSVQIFKEISEYYGEASHVIESEEFLEIIGDLIDDLTVEKPSAKTQSNSPVKIPSSWNFMKLALEELQGESKEELPGFFVNKYFSRIRQFYAVIAV